jgi:hypothetical protein
VARTILIKAFCIMLQSELIIKNDFSSFNQIYFNIIGHTCTSGFINSTALVLCKSLTLPNNFCNSSYLNQSDSSPKDHISTLTISILFCLREQMST